MDAVKLTLWVGEEYRRQINEIREREDLRKCRSVFDLLGAADEKGEVEINRNCIIVRCNTRKGEAVDSCTYDGVLAVTEMRGGILLRLSHKRLLWLPVSGDGQENERLMEAMQWLSVHCKYHFRTARLKLRGVDLGKRIAFRFRPRQGYDMGRGVINGAIAAFICLVLFAGTVFCGEPFRNHKIPQQDAVRYSAVFQQADITRRRSSISYADLVFQNGEEKTVDGCCLGHGLAEKLERLPAGTRMDLLIHPDSETILQIEAEGLTLLDFDYAQSQLWHESLFFAGLGVLMYAVGAYMIYMFIRKKY
jgi:hypothetical protein